ncbi:MAG: hypothetical protein ABR602_06200, partial [Gemmatimonadales bacterium]
CDRGAYEFGGTAPPPAAALQSSRARPAVVRSRPQPAIQVDPRVAPAPIPTPAGAEGRTGGGAGSPPVQH